MRIAKVQETKSILFHSLLRGNSRRRSTALLFGSGLLAMLLAASGASAQSVTATVAAGTQPQAVAVNPVTNKIYVSNFNGNSVTVIDGVTNTPTTIAAGSNPGGIAINPVTNKIYVVKGGSDNVTVIDGATDTTTTVAAGSTPYWVAVNPVTNKIYVANYSGNSVTVIDGATNVPRRLQRASTPFGWRSTRSPTRFT
jgi:YVTN family beta-propeller protein